MLCTLIISLIFKWVKRLKIRIKGLNDHFKTSLERIADLFFEDAQVSINHIDEADIEVKFLLIGDSVIQITGELIDFHTGKKYLTTYKKECRYPARSKEWLKQAKHAVNHVYLSVLQEFTGIEQPWGTLTGVRPTKLLHQKIQQGIPTQQAHEELEEQFMIKPEKISLMQKIVERQHAAIPDLYDLKKGVSIYIGIPYCPTKCAYCTFPAYAITGRQGSVDSFLAGLHYEMREVGRWLKENNIHVTTIYFGGGTPTSITAEEMDALYEEMTRSFPDVEKVREITVEAGRPDTITPEKLEILKKWNIDRISINPQTYIQDTLKAIGRHHTVEETVEKYHLAKKMGMTNINMDLIIGLPGEGLQEFRHTLSETEKLMPESVTVHTLSFKRASEMTKNKDKYKVAGREEVSKMMEEASEWSERNGYSPYYLYRQKNILGNLENVGYSFPGQESLYNIIIMEEVQTIIGIGCGAASKFVHPVTGKITRFANPKEPRAYNISFEKYTDEKIRMLNELFSENQASIK